MGFESSRGRGVVTTESRRPGFMCNCLWRTTHRQDEYFSVPGGGGRDKEGFQIGTIRPIRVDHTDFFKWLLKLIHSLEDPWIDWSETSTTRPTTGKDCTEVGGVRHSTQDSRDVGGRVKEYFRDVGGRRKEYLRSVQQCWFRNFPHTFSLFHTLDQKSMYIRNKGTKEEILTMSGETSLSGESKTKRFICSFPSYFVFVSLPPVLRPEGRNRCWRVWSPPWPLRVKGTKSPLTVMFIVYYESRNRDLKIRLMNEGRCDERLKTRIEESTCLTSHTLGITTKQTRNT